MKQKFSMSEMKAEIKTYFRRLIYSSGVNPLPAITMALIYIILLFNSMIITMVFSFLPQMVKAFGATELNAGYYAGFIASSLFMARIFVSFYWGYISDLKGTKIALIVCSIGLTLATLAFGFSTGFYWALVTRIMQGSLMGAIIISKSIIADICDDTNFSIGMSFVISAYSVGLILGPSIGGFFVFPAEKYPETFSKDSLFKTFPILLPMIVIVSGLTISIILIIVYMPKDKKKEGEYAHLISNSKIRKTYDGDRYSKDFPSTCEEDYLKISFESSASNEKIRKKNLEIFQIVEPMYIEETSTNFKCYFFTGFKGSKLYRILKIKACLTSCVLYGLFAFVSVGYSECLSLFAATSVELNGIGFTTSEIGTELLIVSGLLTVLLVTVLPRVNDYFVSKKSLIISTLGLGFLLPMLPATAAIKNRIALWFVLSIVTLFTQIFITSSFLAINVLLNNSIPRDLTGSANGFAMTVASIGRMLAPTVMGSMYSWSLTNVGVNKTFKALGYPFNQFFVFYFQSLCSIIIAILTSMIPDSMNFEKDSEREERTAYGRSNNRESSSEVDEILTPSVSRNLLFAANENDANGNENEANNNEWRKINVAISTWKCTTELLRFKRSCYTSLTDTVKPLK